MAKFKVGDRVRVLESPYMTYGPGDVLKVKAVGLEGRRGDIEAGALGYCMDLTFYPDELEHITPKPKTIPARNLSGKHIGRVVTAESISGSVGVTATLEAVTQESEKTVLSFRNGGVFNANPIFLMTVSPESEVIVK